MSALGGTAMIHNKIKTGAGVGAGVGTLLAVLGRGLPDGNKMKPLLIVAAPTISVLLSRLWLSLGRRIDNYLSDREWRMVVDGAKSILEEALGNPQTSEAHHARMSGN
jgi:hypothetical protein